MNAVGEMACADDGRANAHDRAPSSARRRHALALSIRCSQRRPTYARSCRRRGGAARAVPPPPRSRGPLIWIVVRGTGNSADRLRSRSPRSRPRPDRDPSGQTRMTAPWARDLGLEEDGIRLDRTSHQVEHGAIAVLHRRRVRYLDDEFRRDASPCVAQSTQEPFAAVYGLVVVLERAADHRDFSVAPRYKMARHVGCGFSVVVADGHVDRLVPQVPCLDDWASEVRQAVPTGFGMREARHDHRVRLTGDERLYGVGFLVDGAVAGREQHLQAGSCSTDATPCAKSPKSELVRTGTTTPIISERCETSERAARLGT